MKKTLQVLALLALAALAIAGCGSTSKSNTATTSSAAGATGPGGASHATAGGGATVSLGSASRVGKVLVDSAGMTLYYFEKDKKGSGKSACSGACASTWPPLTSSGAAKAMGGAMSSMLGTLKRSDGTTQATYNGWPLYTYTADTKPGEANGTDVKSFGASWYPLKANGTKAGS